HPGQQRNEDRLVDVPALEVAAGVEEVQLVPVEPVSPGKCELEHQQHTGDSQHRPDDERGQRRTLCRLGLWLRKSVWSESCHGSASIDEEFRGTMRPSSVTAYPSRPGRFISCSRPAALGSDNTSSYTSRTRATGSGSPQSTRA